LNGQCPKCGRICGRIVGYFLSEYFGGGLEKVFGVCKKHGRVDLTDQDWSYEEFA